MSPATYRRGSADRPGAADGRVTIVMYHFVRHLRSSGYPEIKGLSVEDFKGQLEYFRRFYNIIGANDLMAAVTVAGYELPSRSLLLTFDDGYRDHFSNVLPILAENGLTGCFFPPAKAITERQVLDVNKIHFILATVPDKAGLLDEVFHRIDEARGEFPLRDREDYLAAVGPPNRYDIPEVVVIKRLLQRELPEALGTRITDQLFRRYVSRDEAAFSGELYMGLHELRALREAGMYIGSHGYDHFWLDTLDSARQEQEIDLSLRFLREVGCDLGSWIIAYPYGAYDDRLLQMLRRKGCTAGLTTGVSIADMASEDPLTLSRLDTNDFPKQADAQPNAWTTQVLEGLGAQPE